MQKRPKAQSSLAQSHLIYVIPVETGIQASFFLYWIPTFVGMTSYLGLSPLAFRLFSYFDFNGLLWTSIDCFSFGQAEISRLTMFFACDKVFPHATSH